MKRSASANAILVGPVSIVLPQFAQKAALFTVHALPPACASAPVDGKGRFVINPSVPISAATREFAKDQVFATVSLDGPAVIAPSLIVPPIAMGTATAPIQRAVLVMLDGQAMTATPPCASTIAPTAASAPCKESAFAIKDGLERIAQLLFAHLGASMEIALLQRNVFVILNTRDSLVQKLLCVLLAAMTGGCVILKRRNATALMVGPVLIA